MGARTLLKRLAKAEETAQERSRLSPDCICFPSNEPPFFGSPSEEEAGARVLCPLHGTRFTQPISHLYVSQWRREAEVARRQTRSARYRKAWDASATAELKLPGPKPEKNDGKIQVQ